MRHQHAILEQCNKPYLDTIIASAAELRKPVQGEFEITTCCHFQCKHCYIIGSDCVRSVHAPVAAACRLIDEIASAGCIWLVITGGEPLTHLRFREIWRHAWDRSLRLALFTNGSLIDESMMDFLLEFRPNSIEVSVYSLRERTYREITGSMDGFSKVQRAFSLLREAPFDIFLKTPVLKMNVDEIPFIEDFAREYGFGFRMDAVIHPAIGGNASPVSLRIPAYEAAALAMRDPEIRKSVRRSYDTMSVPFNDADFILPCSAGIYSFHVASDLSLNVCSIFRNGVSDLSRDSFEDGWKRLVAFRAQPKKEESTQCKGCNIKSLCLNCPGIARLHGKPEPFVDQYVCDYAHYVAVLAGILPNGCEEMLQQPDQLDGYSNGVT